VPEELLLEAIFARLEQHETPLVTGVGGGEIPTRLQARPLYPVSIRFQQSSNPRTVPGGIIDWIARSAGRSEWRNPHVAGQLAVSASSLRKGLLPDLVSKQETELWSKDVPASWFSVDFGPERSIIPTHYCLRHGGNYRADSLRNWDLQGSTDGIHWTVLISHRHDDSLQGPFAIAWWELPPVKTAYRYFRVIQTGHNSSSRNFLVLSNLDLYGKLYDRSGVINSL